MIDTRLYLERKKANLWNQRDKDEPKGNNAVLIHQVSDLIHAAIGYGFFLDQVWPLKKRLQ